MMRLEVTMSGADPIHVKVTPKVIVAAERQFKQPMTQIFNVETMSYESITWVAWKAMHTAGHVVKTFDLWLDDLESVEFVGQEDTRPLDGGA